MQATHPRAGFWPHAASIGSRRKQWRNPRLRRNGKVNGGRAATLGKSETSREKPMNYGTCGECAAASRKKKRPPFLKCRERSTISALGGLSTGHYGRGIGLTGGSDLLKNDEFGAIFLAYKNPPTFQLLTRYKRLHRLSVA